MIINFFNFIFTYLKRVVVHCRISTIKKKMGHCGKNVHFGCPNYLLYPHLLFIYDNVHINQGASFILSPFGDVDTGRFVMKKNSTAAQNLTVINHNHSTHPTCGQSYKSQSSTHKGDVVKDIVIEEDAFIGANVTLCAGVIIGRGAIVGAGSVIRRSVPPYAIVYGNPAIVKRFVFTPDQIIEHEKQIYSIDERLSLDEIKGFYVVN